MEAKLTAQIHAFPLRCSAVPAVPVRTYDLAGMAALMGWQSVQPRTQIDRLRALTSGEGLPLPCTHRLRHGHLCRGAAAIDARSRWDAQLVDAWLHRPGPAAPAAHLPALPPGTHHAMAQRAQLLASGGSRA